jgi:hypothetical protein
MEFTLVYQGILKTNGNAKQKQEIRRAFHPQLKALWQYPPLDTMQGLLQENPSKKNTSVIKNVGPFQYATLINNLLKNVAEIEITFLRPSLPGSLIIQGGDIDNRMKTLFDALRMPQVPTEIPAGDYPCETEKPFYCLLEDDALITKVTIQTDRLLEPTESPNYVQLMIHVRTKALVATWNNIFMSC